MELFDGDRPYGIYLKSDRAAYRAVRNRFNAAAGAYRALTETAESMADSQLAATSAGAWGELADTCRTILAETSKDLEIAVWLAAASIHLGDGLDGLERQLDLIREMVEDHWEGVHPHPPDEALAGDEAERRRDRAQRKLAAILQLVGEVEGGGLLAPPLRNWPLVGATCLGDYALADRKGRLADLTEAVGSQVAAEAGRISQTVETLDRLRGLAERLDQTVQVRARADGATPPPVAYLTRTLADMLAALKHLTAGRIAWPLEAAASAPEAAAPAAAEASPGDVAPDAPAGTASAPTAGTAASRAEAVAQVAALARYFRTAEPHSPVYLLLERAVRWAGMPLPALYAELLGAEGEAIDHVARLTGLESAGTADRAAPPAAAPATAPAPAPAPASPPAALTPAAGSSRETPGAGTATPAPTQAPPPAATNGSGAEAPAGVGTGFEW